MFPIQNYQETIDKSGDLYMDFEKIAASIFYASRHMNNNQFQPFTGFVPQIVLNKQNFNNYILNQIQRSTISQSINDIKNNYDDTRMNNYQFFNQYRSQQETRTYNQDYKELDSCCDSQLNGSMIQTQSYNAQPFWIFNNRRFDDMKQYNDHQKAYKLTRASLRIIPKYEELNYLNCPFQDIFTPYQLLNRFSYAEPQKVKIFEYSAPLNSQEYEQMRDDFEKNGVHADWTLEEIASRKDSTLLSINILEKVHFPPLNLPLEGDLINIWKMKDEVKLTPMLPVNTNCAVKTNDNQGSAIKKRLKPNKKSLENVSN